jgi:hypothetical protein
MPVRPFKCDADVVRNWQSAVAQLYSPSCSLFLAQLFSTRDAHLSAPATVDWMARVQRPAIQADIGAEAVQLNQPLGGVVAALAERLKRAKPEFVDVAVMRLDVVANFRCRDDTALETERAQRVFAQLVPPDPRPASRGVPFIPIRRSAAGAYRFNLSLGRSTKHRSPRRAVPRRRGRAT